MSFILGDMPNPMNCTSVFTAMHRTGSGMLEPAKESSLYIFSQLQVQSLHVGNSQSISHSMILENMTTQNFSFLSASQFLTSYQCINELKI